MSRKLLALAVGLALLASVTLATATEPATEAANDAVAYIETLQNADGGFPAFGADSSPGSTLDAVFAFVAAGRDPTAIVTDGNSPADYLAAQADTYSVDAGAAAKLMLGVVVMGLDHRDFGELDLPSVLEGHLAEDPSTGVYGLDLFDQALYILALTAAGEPLRPAAVDYLRSLQVDDGGWEFSPGSGSDSNTTAIALQALIAVGADAEDTAIVAGLEYLHTLQNADGGFGFLPDSESDPNSTAFVIQALAAVGADIGPNAEWAQGGNTPMEAMLAFQNPETGAFQFAGEDSPFATYQAVPALMLAPFPSLEPRILAEATPVAPILTLEVAATPTSAVDAFPSVGGGPGGGGMSWWVVAALLVGALGASASGVAVRRSR